MSQILNIETSTTVCSVALAEAGRTIAWRETAERNQHATHLTRYIQEVLEEAGVVMQGLDAVAVSAGPGSYTGLRIGYSTAKGICYATDKPLIVVNTLKALADASRKVVELPGNALLCPMIDARRMEVYTALFDSNLSPLLPTQALILEDGAFRSFFERGHHLVFSGDGAFKINEIALPGSHECQEVTCSAKNMVRLSYDAYENATFEDIAYATPFYLKAPNITKSKKRL